MAILSTNFTSLLDARVERVFERALMAYPPEYTMYCDVETSNLAEDRMAQVGEMPMPPTVGEYEELPETQFTQGPDLVWNHTKYGYRLIASSELIEDERFGVLDTVTSKIGTAVNHRVETFAASILNNAFTTSNFNNDSETLCATSHAVFSGAGGAAQANRPATEVVFGQDALWAAIDAIGAWKDEEGNPAMKIPATLLGGPSLRREFIEVLQSTGTPYTATLETNATRDLGLGSTLNHYLDSSTAWFIIMREKPVIFKWRRMPQVLPDEERKTDSRSWNVTMRCSREPVAWRNIWGTTGAP